MALTVTALGGHLFDWAGSDLADESGHVFLLDSAGATSLGSHLYLVTDSDANPVPYPVTGSNVSAGRPVSGSIATTLYPVTGAA